MAIMLSDLRAVKPFITPRKVLEVICVRGHVDQSDKVQLKGLDKLTTLMAPLGFEPTIIRLVPQYFNHIVCRQPYTYDV
jgi:hypothetical protein